PAMTRGRPWGLPWGARARLAPAWARPPAAGTRGAPGVSSESPWAARKSSVAAGVAPGVPAAAAARSPAASFAVAWPVAASPVGASAAAADMERLAEAAPDRPGAGRAGPAAAGRGTGLLAAEGCSRVGAAGSRAAAAGSRPPPKTERPACRAGPPAARPVGLPEEAPRGIAQVAALAAARAVAPAPGPTADRSGRRVRSAVADLAEC